MADSSEICGITSNSDLSCASENLSLQQLLTRVLQGSLKIDMAKIRDDNSGIIDFSLELRSMNLDVDTIKANKNIIYNHFFVNSILPIIISQNINEMSQLISDKMDKGDFIENFEEGKTFFDLKRIDKHLHFSIRVARFNQYFIDQFRREFINKSSQVK